MRMPSLVSSLLAPAVLLIALGACDRTPPGGSPAAPGSATPTGSSAVEGDVLATVNGVPIRVSDLHYILARNDRGRGRGAKADKAKEALDKIIEQELTRQRAEALGLDSSADYLRKLRFMEAPVNDFKRTELTELFYRKAIADSSRVDDAEARKFFDEHRARFQTEFHVLQILVRNDEAKIGDLKKQIDGGTPFEEVAATLFSTDLPEGKRPPWDMGKLRFNQVPKPWHDALDKLKEGEVSDILRGPKKRAWIIKLAKRHRNESITFDQAKAEVVELLTSTKAAELAKSTVKELRSKAKIVYVRQPGAMPPPPEPGD